MLNILGALLAFAMTMSGGVADAELKAKYTDEELVKILKADGYQNVEVTDPRVIRLKIDGRTYILQVYEDNDLQLYFGLTGYKISPATINKWNASMRVCRAYIDDENDPVVESDLLAGVGYTPKQLLEFVQVFDGTARAFRRFLNDHDEAE